MRSLLAYSPPFLAIALVVAIPLLYSCEPDAARAQSEDWKTHKQQRCMEVAERARSLWRDMKVYGYLKETINDSDYLKDVAAEAETDRAAYDKVMGDCMGLTT